MFTSPFMGGARSQVCSGFIVSVSGLVCGFLLSIGGFGLFFRLLFCRCIAGFSVYEGNSGVLIGH